MATINSIGSNNPIQIEMGGTEAATFTDHGLLVGSGVDAMTALAVGATNQVLLGATGADPTWGAVPNAALANSSITLSNGNNITVTGSPVSLGGTATFNLTGTTDHAVQVGNATGSLTSLAVGATGEVLIGNTTADPSWSSTPTVTTIYATTFDTNVAAAGVTLSGTTLSADGTDVDININITAKGTGQVIIDDLQLTTDLAVTEGGTGVSTLTDHGLLVGSDAAAITALAVGTTGVVLQGSTGADPVWSTTTYPSTSAQGDVVYASAANTYANLAKSATATRYIANTGADNSPAWDQIDLSNGVTGTLPVANGGTGAVSLTDHAVLLGSDTSAITAIAVGATGEVLIGNTGADASWSASPTLTSVLATTFDTNVAAAGVTLSGTSLTADGTDVDISINITAKGTGKVIIDDLQLTADLAVTEGGTGASTLTDHGVLVGSDAAAITALAVGTDGQVLLGSSAADPVFATLTSTGTIAFTPGAGTLALDCRAATDAVTGVVELASDAEAIAGAASTAIICTSLKAKLGAQTQYALPIGAGDTAALAWTAAPTNGQLLVGSTGGTPVLATLTEGANVTITNGAGTITIAAAGGSAMPWTVVTDATVALDGDNAYIMNRGTAITATLPAAATVGEIIKITGIGAGLTVIAQNAGQTIHFGDTDTTTGAGGSLTATAVRDSLELVCVVTDTDFNVISSMGNWTIV